MARITEYDYDMCVEVCERISMGEHVKTVLESEERYPTFQTWCNWKRANTELFDLYTRSIQDKSEMVTFEIGQTMQDLKDGLIDAQSARVIIDTLKWLASKFYPKMYGDKIDVTTDNKAINQPVSVCIDGNPVNLSAGLLITPPRKDNE